MRKDVGGVTPLTQLQTRYKSMGPFSSRSIQWSTYTQQVEKLSQIRKEISVSTIKSPLGLHQSRQGLPAAWLTARPGGIFGYQFGKGAIACGIA